LGTHNEGGLKHEREDGSKPKLASLTMPIPNEITDILSQFSVPAGAIALAVGLVRGAKALEKDATEHALKYVSGLLIGGSVADFGKLGATLIPIIFDRIFGSRPLSYKFISRSLLATTVFWLKAYDFASGEINML
jgi:hypothetical protein